MSAHLWKIALVVTMTHGFRELGRRSGPRWGALALGLPCSTAVALIGRGLDQGVMDAVVMAGSSLFGLVGAVAMPTAFAASMVRGWGLGRSVVLGVVAYLTFATIASRIGPSDELAGPILVALMALIAGHLASKLPVPTTGVGPGKVRPSKARTLALRTLVPVVCLSASIALGKLLGPAEAGLMSTFPGMTLTVLILTHLEAGAGPSIRMARVLPMGNLGMVAFLAAFRLGCPRLGLGWGIGYAYLAAIGTLGLVVALGDRRAWFRSGRRPDLDRWVTPSWPRAGRRFLPLVETFAT